MPNALKDLQRYGQSVWLDYIRRSLITGGELQRLLDEDGLRGVTSNPAIFEKAIAGSADYEDQLRELTKRHDVDAKAAYEVLAVRDIQDVADILEPDLYADRPARRLRESRGLARPGPRHARHARRGAAPVEDGGTRQRHDQGAGHARRGPGHP